jgi:hypothetical protein
MDDRLASWLGTRGVAFKTINLHGSVVVTADAKIGGGCVHTIRLLTGMAADASLKTVFGTAYAAMYSFISLVLEVKHVIAANGGHVFYAASSTC